MGTRWLLPYHEGTVSRVRARGATVFREAWENMGLRWRIGGCAFAAALGGCGGPVFETGDASPGGATMDAPASVLADSEASAHAEASSEGGGYGLESGVVGGGDAGNSAGDGALPCAPLTAGATDVYVDKTFSGMPQYGSAGCPFTTITQGTSAAATLSGTVTVHVAGGSPALLYDETNVVTVATSVVLLGAGPSSTVIHASGTCGTGTCAVIVSAGGTLEGFTVTDATGSGILALAGIPAPAISNVVASGNEDWGITANGAIELGPNFAANSNGMGGLESPATASGRIHVIGAANSFNDNTSGNGINVDGPAYLLFEGGTANGNGQGIRLAGTPGPAGSPHVITNLTATGNTGPGGLVAYAGQNITLRSSTLLGNTSVGLLYDYENGSVLDIGSTIAGDNVFGGTNSAMNNGKAGLRLCAIPAAINAIGDSWSSCAPVQTLVACSGTLPSAYSDIQYTPSASTLTNPVTATSCTTGP